MKQKVFLFLAILCLFNLNRNLYGETRDSLNLNKINQKNFTVSGIIKDEASGETLPYARVGVEDKSTGAISNQYGFYSLTLPAGKYMISFLYMGHEETKKEIIVDRDIRLDIDLPVKSQQLEEVTITEQKNGIENIERRMSTIDMRSIKTLPSLGEPDILRNIQFLPGVTSVSEIRGGIQVRGGSSDQNLILLDEAIVYNANHLLGMYSTFNPDIVKDIKFYKSGIPAVYGGRTSSAMDITQKDGNMKSFHVSGGVGVIASKLTLEGPISKDKSSFIISARRSYVDLFFKYIKNKNVHDSRTYFYDLNSKINFVINANNRIYFSSYLGKDLNNVVKYNENYGNLTSTLRYNHIFNQKLFSNTSIIYSKYNMANNESSEAWAWKNSMGLDHYEFKNEFMYFLANHKIEFGVKGIYYTFHPGDLQPVGDSSNITQIKIPKQYALESSVYVDDKFQLNSKIEIQFGVRFSNYYYLGPSEVPVYMNDKPKDPTTIINVISYKRNKVIQSYNNFEPRLSIKFNIANNHSIKVSYNKMAQYIQQVSNTVTPLPYSMWKASNNYIKPLTSQQYAIGYFSEIFNNSVEFSLELYYKEFNNVIETKPGTDISLNKNMDADLLQGIGKAYGFEVMINKTKGKFTSMISYTCSRTKKQINGEFKEEKINLGNWYPANYDIPNKLTITGEYKMSKWFSFTADFTYQTGRPVTLPSGQYIYFNTYVPYYSGINLQRLPDYHRLDVGAVLYGKPKKNRKWEDYWTFSIYNIYARKNVYSLFIREIPNTKNTEAVRIWLTSIVPTVSYNFKF